MPETETVHLGASLDSVATIRETDEGEALGKTRIAILGKEDTSDATEPLEHIAELLFLGHLGDLSVENMLARISLS